MKQEPLNLSDEEKKFWLCDNCECELINCECGEKQKITEIDNIQSIFGTSYFPATVKFDPMINKVIVKAGYVDVDEDYEISKLEDFGFYICGFKMSRSDGAILYLKRIR